VNQSQLPGEIASFLDAGVHALPPAGLWMCAVSPQGRIL
jgi:hypothetical protein